MLRNTGVTIALMSVAFGLGYIGHGARVDAQQRMPVLELRMYTANDGKLEALVKRMGGGEARFFEKYGMKNVFHGVAADSPASQNTYIYVLAHESRDAAKKAWDGFRNDPDWKTLRATSEANGPLVGKVESIFVTPTDFSAVH